MKIQINNPLNGNTHTAWHECTTPDWFYRKSSLTHSSRTYKDSVFGIKDIQQFCKQFGFSQIDEDCLRFQDSKCNWGESWWSDKYQTCLTCYLNNNEKHYNTVKLLYSLECKSQKLIDSLDKISRPLKSKENFINLITTSNMGGFTLKPLEIKKQDNIDLTLNYNQGFDKVDKQIKSILNSDENGILILNGQPGTGKTSYIRYLLSVLNKKVIYIPPNMVEKISDPSLVTFLLDHPDSILLIEDAEEAVIAREDNVRTQSVSNLLNLSDGILGDCLRMKILCTFNVDIHRIDDALLRRGRLKIKYEFKPLSIENSNKLLKSLGKDCIVDKPSTLAELYNITSDNLYKPKETQRLGF